MPPDDLPSVRTTRIPTPPFEVWIAVAAIYTGLSRLIPFLTPAGNARAVEAQFPRLAVLWSILYALGGLGMLIGLYRHSPRAEAMGLHFFGSGLTVAVLAALAAGAPVRPTLVIQGGAIVAVIARLWILRRLS